MLYLLEKTDQWHSTGGRTPLAVCTTEEKAVRIAGKVAREEGYRLTKQDKDSLLRDYQTQGYEHGEFVITEIEKNKLIN